MPHLLREIVLVLATLNNLMLPVIEVWQANDTLFIHYELLAKAYSFIFLPYIVSSNMGQIFWTCQFGRVILLALTLFHANVIVIYVPAYRTFIAFWKFILFTYLQKL